jgi:hypothetical protein
VVYAVIPDCGKGACAASLVEAAQLSVSHELAEAITDPEGPLTERFAQPTGWYDRANGEIADICENVPAGRVVVKGKKFPVVKIWSNKKNACVTINS